MFEFWNNLNIWKKILIVVVFALIIATLIGIILYILLHKTDHKESFTESDEYTGNNVIWSFCKAWRDGILGIINNQD